MLLASAFVKNTPVYGVLESSLFFPATADVMLRSQTGALKIHTENASPTAGAVNFYNVKHLGISSDNLTRNQFNGVDGHINSSATLPNGTPFIKIRAQSAQ